MRNGAPGRVRSRRLRRREVHRLRVRRRHRAPGAPPLLDRRYPDVLRERPALSDPGRVVKAPLAWLREFAAVPDDARAVASRLASCGFEVASIEHGSPRDHWN